MKIQDIHFIEPLAAVYEFDPTKQYIIYVPHSADIKSLIRCGGLGIRAQIMTVENPAEIRIVEGNVVRGL
jgi:hypothetical protein